MKIIPMFDIITNYIISYTLPHIVLLGEYIYYGKKTLPTSAGVRWYMKRFSFFSI